MRRIPEKDKRLMQVPQSDVLGNIHGSYNLDLTSNQGRIRVGNALLPNTASSELTFGDTTSSVQTSMGIPTGFAYFESNTLGRRGWYAICSGTVFKSGTVGGSFNDDTTTGVPTGQDERADIKEFNSKLYVLGDVLYTLNTTGDWTSQAFSGDGSGGRMEVYGNRLYIQAGEKVLSMNTSDTIATSGSYTLDLGGGDKNSITSIKASSDRLWIATVNRYYGQGTVYEWDGVTENIVNRAIKLGAAGAMAMTIKDDIPWIIDSEGVLRQFNGSRFAERARLPIDTNLYFDDALGADSGSWFVHPNGMTVHNARILVLARTGIADGSYSEVLPSGIWEYDENIGFYHKHSLGYTNNYGQFALNDVGALIASKQEESIGGNLLVGGIVTGDVAGIWSDDIYYTESKSGYLITTKIESSQIQDIWQKVWCKYKDSAEIVVKYRVEGEQSDTFDITWTDGNTFTSTDDLSDYEAGNEVEVLSGQGGISHITSISQSGGTYTVEVDETVTGLTGSAVARLSNWKKAGKMTTGTFQELPIGEKSNWLQLKVVMYFDGSNEIEEIIIDNQIDK